MPTILAIETSSELASCALLRDGVATVRESPGVRTHSASVLPMVQALLSEAGLTLDDVDAVAFGAGPGSFTGVRTACGIAQGLAFGATLPVVPVVTLEAAAERCWQVSGAREVLVVLDARMGEVYWAQYRRTGDGWSTVHEGALCAPGAVAPTAVAGLAACGNGLDAYPGAFEGAAFSQVVPGIMPHAEQVARIGLAGLAEGRAVGAAQAQPLYLRNKVAYTSAERQRINAGRDAA